MIRTCLWGISPADARKSDASPSSDRGVFDERSMLHPGIGVKRKSACSGKAKLTAFPCQVVLSASRTLSIWTDKF